jgi:hypothetical protein
MLGELVRLHAPQQHSANPKMRPRALDFGDECIGCLVNTVVNKCIGGLPAVDHAPYEQPPKARC